MSGTPVSGHDFAVVGREQVATRGQLVELLRDLRAPAIRLCGSASSFDRLPPPAQPVCLVSTAPMDRVLRLEAGDLTCSVEPGVTRAALDAALAPHKLVLPCPGTGTIGGLLARGEHQPLAPGELSARNIVLGLEGVLADGTAFKVGARVVKSVAGFDVHRAFVGSRGRLFAATALHLRLRPAARARFAFALAPTDPERALARFKDLRLLATPPNVLVLQRGRNGAATVAGVFAGGRDHVQALGDRLALPPAEGEPHFDLACAAGEELIDGVVQPSALPRLLAALPAGAPVLVAGTGQFLVALAPADADALLATLPSLPGGAGEVRRGAPGRRGKATRADPGAARLEGRLRAQLDPRGVLQ